MDNSCLPAAKDFGVVVNQSKTVLEEWHNRNS